MFSWNAAQYSKFEEERTLPAIDLANAIQKVKADSILDVGCGIGNSTAVLAGKFPGAAITGIDSSDDMLSAARKNHPQIEFVKLDAETEIQNLKTRYDIVFSNACLQWIPHHRSLLRNLFSLLNEDGVLAVQIPQQAKHPVHGVLTSLSESKKWKQKFSVARKYNNLTESEYFDVLSDLTENFRIWETTYFFSMPSHESLVEWYQGTGLRPYLNQLSPDEQEEYLRDFLQCLKKLYPMQKNGKIIFRFPRLFFLAQK